MGHYCRRFWLYIEPDPFRQSTPRSGHEHFDDLTCYSVAQWAVRFSADVLAPQESIIKKKVSKHTDRFNILANSTLSIN